MFKSIGVITNSFKPPLPEIENIISDLESVFSRSNYNKEDIVNIMKEKLPDFNHIETGKTLDQKM